MSRKISSTPSTTHGGGVVASICNWRMTGASAGQRSRSFVGCAGSGTSPGVWQMSAGQRLKFWLAPLWIRIA